MVATTDGAGSGAEFARKLEVAEGMQVQEIGWDSDCDSAISEGVEDIIGAELLEEGTYEVVDAVLMWWRDEDGDLGDALMDAIGPLSDEGFVWVLTPKAGTEGAVEPSEIAESARIAGLTQTSSVKLGEWLGSRLMQPRNRVPRR